MRIQKVLNVHGLPPSMLLYARTLFAKVIQEYTLQLDQTLDVASNLYGLYTQTISKWVQPANAENAYNAGDWVTYNEYVYRFLVDNNI